MAVVFETKKDLERELSVMEYLADVIESKNGKRPKFEKLDKFDLDFKMDNGYYVEIKCYNSKSTDFKTQIISLNKVSKMQKKRKCLLVLSYTDCVLVSKVWQLSGEMRYGGRDLREGSVNDRELLIYLDKSNFRKI